MDTGESACLHLLHVHDKTFQKAQKGNRSRSLCPSSLKLPEFPPAVMVFVYHSRYFGWLLAKRRLGLGTALHTATRGPESLVKS